MTVCGLVRLDGAGVRRSALTAMLAASAAGLPAARGVHLDGPFGAVTAAALGADPTPPIAVDDAGLVVIVDRSPRRAADNDDDEGRERARGLAAAYRRGGQWALLRSGTRALTIVWDPSRARLVLARPSSAADEVVTWSDGRVFAFGPEAEQVLSAGDPGRPFRLARLARLGPGEVLAVAATVPARLRRPGLAALRSARVDSDVS